METTCGGSSMSREAMQQALEALESDPISHAGLVSRKQAITALRQALETEQEPVAWMTHTDDLIPLFHKTRASALNWQTQPTPLYTAPLKKEWVGLTAPEVQECYDLNPARFASRIEAKLKEKNHGH